MKFAWLLFMVFGVWTGVAFAAKDTTPPAPITDLDVGTGKTTAAVSWHDTGDDSTSGSATSYEIRRSTTPITSGSDGQVVDSGPVAGPNGTFECKTLTQQPCGTQFYWAVILIDNAHNRSALGNVVNRPTRSCDSIIEVSCINLLEPKGLLPGNSRPEETVDSWHGPLA